MELSNFLPRDFPYFATRISPACRWCMRSISGRGYPAGRAPRRNACQRNAITRAGPPAARAAGRAQTPACMLQGPAWQGLAAPARYISRCGARDPTRASVVPVPSSIPVSRGGASGRGRAGGQRNICGDISCSGDRSYHISALPKAGEIHCKRASHRYRAHIPRGDGHRIAPAGQGWRDAAGRGCSSSRCSLPLASTAGTGRCCCSSAATIRLVQERFWVQQPRGPKARLTSQGCLRWRCID